MKALFLLCTLALGIGSLQAQTAATADVEAVDKQFDAGFVAADVNAVLKYVASDCVFYGTDPADQWTVETFGRMIGNNFKNNVSTPVTTARTIRLLANGNMAVITKRIDWPIFKTPLQEIAVYEKGDGWKLKAFYLNILFPDKRMGELNQLLSK